MIDSKDTPKSDPKALSSNVEVTVKTRFLTEQSQPAASRFAYSYEITIANNSAEAVQLLNRHWFITEEADIPQNATTKEVKGPGVIGQQPIIASGQQYSYASGAVIASPIGTMKGSYEMQTLKGVSFDVEIPTFALIQPHKLH